ncbi:MAG: type IV pilus assembly protein PilQ [Magnetococcales bacterium]|nr:type IV pilus assembly protein PilQ [Magnetococcales bacterium]HIJ83402.1 type IV pilus secretin PilQ [Magnetococcales bacterium]
MKVPPTVYGNTGYLMLLVFLCLILGSAPFPAWAADEATPIPAEKAPGRDPVTPPTLIQSIGLGTTQRGPVFDIVGDRPIQYKIYNLSAPPKLLLVITNARLSPMIQPIRVDADVISSVYPTQIAGGDVRIEIALKKSLAHDIVTDHNRLVLTVLTQEQTEQQKPLAQGLDVIVEEMTTTVRVKGKGPGPTPRVYKLHNPTRTVMDLAGFEGPKNSKTEKVISPEISAAELIADGNKSRLVVTMKSPDILFSLVTQHGMPALVFSQPKQVLNPDPSELREVEDVAFERDGETAVIRIATAARQTRLKVNRTDSDLNLVLSNLRLPQRLVRRMDVTQFASPVTAIDTYAKDNGVHVVVRLAHPSLLHEIIESPGEILVRIRPVKTAGDEKANNAYTGKKMSMDFKDINVHNALKLIADVSQLNIILADTVTGTLTMRLVDVPWDQALDLVLSAKGLGKETQGNVIRIAPLAEIQASADAQRKAKDSQKQLEPFVTELIPVSFAKAQDIVTLLKEGVNNEQRGTRILSAEGAISLDARTSTLIIKDTAGNIAAIRDLISKLDKPTAQVLIEARVVRISRLVDKNLGISWGASFKPQANSSFGISDSKGGALEVYKATGTEAMLTTAQPAMVSLGTGGSGRIGMHMGTLSPLLDLDIELSALEVTGKAKTISSPRVLTMDNQQASITQGDKLPFNTESESGGTTVQFIEASLKLDVTPHITPNGYIALTVSVADNGLGTGSSPPPINTKEIKTQALVRNNETIVLGGIFMKNEETLTNAIPGLESIPFIGDLLFKTKNDAMSQSELLIFITPSIVQPSDS